MTEKKRKRNHLCCRVILFFLSNLATLGLGNSGTMRAEPTTHGKKRNGGAWGSGAVCGWVRKSFLRIRLKYSYTHTHATLFCRMTTYPVPCEHKVTRPKNQKKRNFTKTKVSPSPFSMDEA